MVLLASSLFFPLIYSFLFLLSFLLLYSFFLSFILSMNQQETLSRSYTDSISSYLYDSTDQTHPENHHRPTSIHSNQSHYNTTGYTTPITAMAKGRSIMDITDHSKLPRRGSAVTDNGSFYYDSIREEDDYSNSSGGSQFSDENTEEAITPLPKLQMLIVSIILFSEPLTSTILFPFIYFMVSRT
jgi:hypothetical protein